MRPLPIFFVVLVSSLQAIVQPVMDSSDYTTSWAVEIDGDSKEADRLAKAHGFLNMGQVYSYKYPYYV